MEEIIDLPKQEPKNLYLKKSARLYKISVGLMIFAVLMSAVIRPLLYERYSQFVDLADMFVGIPVLINIVLSPLGLYYSLKSYRRKEGHRMVRLKYLAGHLFFCLLIVLIIAVLISDITMLFE